MTTTGEESKLESEKISRIESNQRESSDGWAIASFILALISYPLSPILVILLMYMMWNSPSTISIGTVALLPYPFSLFVYILIPFAANIPCWLSIVLGFVSLSAIKKDAQKKGRGLAIAGIVLGFVCIFIMILLLFLIAWNLVYPGS